MPPIKLQYLECFTARGRPFYYYRRNGQRHKLPGDPSKVEFFEAYNRLHTDYEKSLNGGGDMMQPNSTAAVIRDYKQSADFKNLSAASKRNYGMYLDRIQEKFGPIPIEGFTRKVVRKWRDSMADNPSVANHALAVMRKLLNFAYEEGKISSNPALRFRKMKTGVWHPWPQEEISRFRQAAPAHMVLALELGLYTGQRRGDILAMRWSQVREGGIDLTQGKTGARLWIPMHRDLLAAINKAAENKTALSIVTTGAGRPWKANEFSKEFRKVCKNAGVSGQYVFHGLRKNATIKLLEAGCTTAQVKAITGHATDEMVNHYGAEVNQKKLARQAMEKWERED